MALCSSYFKKTIFFTLNQVIPSQDNGFFDFVLLVFYSGVHRGPKILTLLVLPLDCSRN